MMSTPMASSSSATSSFSSWVMVAPGDCSPSRNVVSKMTTRSFSDLGWVVMGRVLLVACALIAGARGFLGSVEPLSAQARTPARPSGDAKEQEPAENEGGAGPGLRPPGDRAEIAADRHRFPRHGHQGRGLR